jgi:ABC-type phosphate transport system ATPase subunit
MEYDTAPQQHLAASPPPTNSCRVEAVLRQVASSAAVLWVTHDDQQPARVGGKVMVLPSGGYMRQPLRSPQLEKRL